MYLFTKFTLHPLMKLFTVPEDTLSKIIVKLSSNALLLSSSQNSRRSLIIMTGVA